MLLLSLAPPSVGPTSSHDSVIASRLRPLTLGATLIGVVSQVVLYKFKDTIQSTPSTCTVDNRASRRHNLKRHHINRLSMTSFVLQNLPNISCSVLLHP